jgi:ankyrin repeat protein
MNVFPVGLLSLALLAASPGDIASSRTPVADASRAGDRETVRALLQQGEDVNAAQGDGMTALHWAASSGDLETAKMLLVAGANVKASTRLGGFTPLLLASKNGHPLLVSTFLEASANPNDATTNGSTALMLAAASGSADAVSALLDHGASVNATESAMGQTALMFASAYDRAPVVELLARRGADLQAMTKVVDAAAIEKEHRELRRKRQEKFGVFAQGRGGRAQEEEEAEKKSSGGGVFSKLFGFLRPGGDSKKKEESEEDKALSYGQLVGNQGGMTALHLAARQGNIRTVEGLLAAGADVNALTAGDKTSPLLIATVNGHFDLGKYLLDRGADPKLASEAGATPLYAAVNVTWAPKALYPQPRAYLQQRLSSLDFIKALLDKGADPNARLKKKLWYSGYNFDLSGVDESGATPFWRAAYAGDVEAMELLKAHGADSSIPTVKPKGRPRTGDGTRQVKDLSGLPPVPVGGPAVTPLQAAAGVGYGEGFAANSHRHHPAGLLRAVKYLVEECGADVNAVDHEGNTALHHAAARGDNEMILYLVSKGADVTRVNREGQTTADMANGPVQRVQPFPETVALLEKLGSKNNHKCVSC